MVCPTTVLSTPTMLGWTIRWMDETEKHKRNCCCKLLKDKYRLMKTGRLTVVGKAFVMHYYPNAHHIVPCTLTS